MTGIDPKNWIERHGDALFRYALIRSRNPARAEELVQDTFLAGLKAIDRFAGQSSERTWLIGILKHKIIDHLRKSSREVPADPEGLAHSENPFTEGGLWQKGPEKWRFSSTPIESAEFRVALDACLQKLPKIYADAFWLREIEGLSGDEVCEILAITPTNLWSRVHRARMMLRECIEQTWFRNEGSGG